MFESVLSAIIGTFTVNTAAVAVDVTPAGTPNIFKGPGGEYALQKQDNVLFKSCSIVFPYCFCQADDRLSVDLFYRDVGDAIYRQIQEFNSVGRIWQFSENVEVELSTFWRWNQTHISAENYTWFAGQANQHLGWNTPTSYIRVSMVNCPAALHGTLLPVYCFLKIIHTLPLTIPII